MKTRIALYLGVFLAVVFASGGWARLEKATVAEEANALSLEIARLEETLPKLQAVRLVILNSVSNKTPITGEGNGTDELEAMVAFRESMHKISSLLVEIQATPDALELRKNTAGDLRRVKAMQAQVENIRFKEKAIAEMNERLLRQAEKKIIQTQSEIGEKRARLRELNRRF